MYVAMGTRYLLVNHVLALGCTTWYKLVKSKTNELPVSYFSLVNRIGAERNQSILYIVAIATNCLQSTVALAYRGVPLNVSKILWIHNFSNTFSRNYFSHRQNGDSCPTTFGCLKLNFMLWWFRTPQIYNNVVWWGNIRNARIILTCMILSIVLKNKIKNNWKCRVWWNL